MENKLNRKPVYKSLYSFLIIMALWTLMHVLIDSRIVPSPWETFMVFFQIFIPELLPHTMMSLYRIVIAVAITLAIGIPFGLFIATHKQVDQYVSPVIYTLYPVPKIAFLPVLMLLFGLGDLSKIILVSIILIFQVIVSTRDSVKGLDKELFYSIKSLGANKFQVYRHMILPAVLPNLLTSLRISIGTSISVLFFAENYATNRGIGFFIMDSWLKLAYVDMFAGIVMISLMGIALFRGIDVLERKFCRWMGGGHTSF